ncbi:hypothetical protein ACFQ2X_05560 [Microbulbifer celer]|uniref:Uncharacterized protein n=2 Tax=Microbulbifer celer TaxID=435905 RepID=A0ABW3U5E4_9GAMM
MINAWKQFLNSQQTMFFTGRTPRVFTRELLGLKFFGYKPEFSWNQLSFGPDSRATIRPDFQTYLRKLREVRFEAGDRARVTQEISTFLFGEQNALGANWT